MPSAGGGAPRGCEGRRSIGRRLSYLPLRLALCLQGLLTQPLRRDDRGATAVEYALIATLIAVVIVVAVRAVGTRVVTMFTSVANAF